MPNDLKTETIALRDKAWEGVKSTLEYTLFKALDDAVAAIGEATFAGGLAAMPPASWLPKPTGTFMGAGTRALSQPKKMSQTEVAAQVLREAGEPLPIGRLLERVIAKGVVFRGEDPLPSFRSAMSKDARLESVVRNNMYFWWFEGEALPLGWNATAGDDLLSHPAVASVPSSLEGGDGRAANNTNLT